MGTFALAMIMAVSMMLPASAAPTSVAVVNTSPGEVTLQFINPNSYIVCFEYRTDGDTSQASGNPNYNTNYTDLYPNFCLTNESTTMTFEANAYVEIRSVFGGERDIDFDWITFYVGQDPACDGTYQGRGGSGSDALGGTSGPDSLNGRSGHDVLCGFGGDDSLKGGSGNDYLAGGNGEDVLTGNSGNDTMTGGNGADVFKGGSGYDTVTDFECGYDSASSIEEGVNC